MPRKNSKHLTDPGIEKIGRAPKGKRVERFDAGAPGLCLRVTDKGIKSWSVYYRLGKKHLRITIGPWPTVGVAEAREEARDVKAQAKAGIDPKKAREAGKFDADAEAEAAASKNFGPVAERYIKRECSKLKRGSEIESIIRRELLPAWKDSPMDELRRGDLTELTDALIDDERPMAAHKLHEVTKRVFNWAVDRGDLEASPFAAMKAPVTKTARGRVLTHDEIRALWPTWEAMGYPFGPMYQLLLLTGQRLTEVAGMRWREIDLEKGAWTIPAERSKSKREHIVPLADSAIAILGTLPRFLAGDHAFTTTEGQRPVSGFSKAKDRADTMSKITGWRAHDLRRTVRTGLARLGVPEIVGERVLNHLPRGLSRIYNVHEYLDEKRGALAKWSVELESIKSPPPENVIPLIAEGAKA